jgi:acetyltransferase-like isoleucine patch superfamily enzyme
MNRFFSEFRLYICNNIIANTPSHRLRLFYYRKVMGFTIGKQSAILMNCKFDAARGLIIGDHSVINANCRLDTRGGLEISDNVSISENVHILSADHDMNSINFGGRKKKVKIRAYVWIGTRATILPGVDIGEGSVVAACALVSKSIDPFNVVAGIPAKVIKKRQRGINYTLNYRRLFQ